MASAQGLTKDIEVFISYSHEDENLKNELEKHLSNLKRLGLINTWSFREIGAGDEWQGAIDDHLNSAQIILLLISPDFMASDYSYDIEMGRALERHESGEARVIPIILRHVDWTGAPFTKLQFLPNNSKPVTSDYWGSLDKAFLNVAQGIGKEIKKLTSDSSINQPRPSLIVDQMERGGYTTINEAINAAERGDKILVRQGVYDEAIIMTKPLEIVGDGNLGDVVIRTKEKDTVRFEASTGRINNLMLRQNGRAGFVGINITQGNLVVDNCDISSNSLSCIAIEGNAFPKITKNRIHSSAHNGIILADKSQGLIEENEIFNNAISGIAIEEESNPTIKRNNIRDNKMNGILITSRSQGTIVDNDIFRNVAMGVEIELDSNPMLLKNKIYNNKKSGIGIHKNAQGSIENNLIYDNFDSGIVIHESNPSLLRNRIYDNNKNLSTEDYNEIDREEIEPLNKTITKNIKNFINNVNSKSPRAKEAISGSDLIWQMTKSLTKNIKKQVYLPQPTASNAGVLILSGDPNICQNQINKNHGYGIFILNGRGTIEDNDLQDNEMGPYYMSRPANFKINRNNGILPERG
jgi:parallel beta-helix repeat protein